MRHRIRVVTGGYSVHHVAHLNLSSPTCTCGWSGAWVRDPAEARQHGTAHVEDPGPDPDPSLRL